MPVSHAWGAITPEQRAQLQDLRDRTQAAGKLFAAGDLEQSAERVQAIQTQLLKLLETKDKALWRSAKPLYDNVARAHALLELEGFEMQALPSWQEVTSEAPMPGTGAPPNTPSSGLVSFQSTIAPWIQKQCGNCHVKNSRGKFSMASYSALMRGTPAGVVLFAGSASGNRIVEVIESGDMPRGGGKVAPEDLKLLIQWIAQGAKFDGQDPEQNLAELTQLTATPPPAEMTLPGPMLQNPTGKETVSFASDVAPILLENCQGCHINGRQASGNLRMNNFNQILRGGDSGPLIVGRNAPESLLIKKLKGEAGQRMPAGGRPALSSTQIDLISKWISEGSTYDGKDPGAPLADVVSGAWVANADHAELFQQRQQRALERWRKVLPNDEPATASNDAIYVLGNVPTDRLDELLQQLTAAASEVQKLLRLPSDKPLIHGGAVVYVLRSRYDYSEFGRMTENRELPKDWLGHWQTSIIDTYGVVADDQESDSNAAESLAVQILAGAYIGSLSDVPAWFAEGTARALVFNNFRRKNPRVQAWQQALPSALQRVPNAKSLLNGKLDEESAGLVGMSFANYLMSPSTRRRFDKLLEQLQAGTSFDEALTMTFGPPQLLLKAWLGK
ncbi:c-type cytochrome domain-containing protein [Aureliella helgolandensis]|uniref:c-type cytochrome domain-containing protein n=1 Tax=Aureliella helgolandensis TaxID=2527968 RepID=UPI0018D1F00F|nr:c-type cytochrome domain-containing protein [Aureliella helgolandensis]